MTRPAAHRVGEPAPLTFHLGVALSAYSQALLASPRADTPDFPWVERLRPESGELAHLDRFAVAREAAARLSATVAGLEAWQAHPYRRSLPDAAGDLAGPAARGCSTTARSPKRPTRPARRCSSCRA